jgi:hypothetical protein
MKTTLADILAASTLVLFPMAFVTLTALIAECANYISEKLK